MGPWKVLYGTATGTAHERAGEGGQDYVLGRLVSSPRGPILVAVCADGAGSSRHGAVGAKRACAAMVSLVSSELDAGAAAETLSPTQVLRWHEMARGQLGLEGCVRNLDTREFACTLLTAIVGNHHAVLSQVGDGAIVLRVHGQYRTAFWPQSGEYANSTWFLTGADLESRLAVLSLPEAVEEIAMFTDGLQPLALHYATRTVHVPFFEPMFRALRQAERGEDLESALRQFLCSMPINDRTDDDKTLLLASRLPADHDRP